MDDDRGDNSSFDSWYDEPCSRPSDESNSDYGRRESLRTFPAKKDKVDQKTPFDYSVSVQEDLYEKDIKELFQKISAYASDLARRHDKPLERVEQRISEAFFRTAVTGSLTSDQVAEALDNSTIGRRQRKHEELRKMPLPENIETEDQRKIINKFIKNYDELQKQRKALGFPPLAGDENVSRARGLMTKYYREKKIKLLESVIN